MKHTHRFFTSRQLAVGQPVALEPEDNFHAARILRLRPGDRLELADPEGRVFTARVTSVNGEVEVAPDGLVDDQVDSFSLHVVQALPSGQKMDLVVEKLSELGVERLTPVYSQKSVARPGGGRRHERWQRLARAASAIVMHRRGLLG